MNITCPEGINDQELEKEILTQDTTLAHQIRYEKILKNVLPYLGSNEGKIILAQILIALKVEGIVKSHLTKRETKMVKVIKDTIMQVPQKKQNALKYAKKLLDSGS